MQDFFYTTIGLEIIKTTDKRYLYIPKFNHDPETQVLFNQSIKNGFILPTDSWTTDKKSANTDLEYQLVIGSSSISNSPEYLVAAYQTEARA